ncbi:MAG: SDR family NAD(P)-dependent oxidoreductase [Myxococcota bacterium]
MRDDLDRWQQDGIRVALVGNGTRAFAEAFIEDFGLSCDVLVDPELVAYRAAGLRRGAEALLSRRLFSDALRARRSGARQSGVQGDAWQLGGAFVFRRGGELLLIHRAESSGDHVEAHAVDHALEEDVVLDESPPPRSPLAPVARATRDVLDLSPVGSFDRIGFARHALGFDPADLDVDLTGRRALVTGANSGIGYATSLALADLGAEVTLLCRNAERAEAAAARIREATGSRRVSWQTVDMSDLTSVEAACAELAKEPIDVLVHNAGVLPDDRIESKEGLELTFATHVAGPHLMTARLREALEASDDGRVVWVSSGGMLTTRLQMNDPQWRHREYDGVRAYAETKRAQVVLAELWAAELAGSGVVVHSMHPGWADTPAVASSLPRFHQVTEAILRTPEEGADTVIWLAAADAATESSGRFFFDREAVRTHWLPVTRETRADREALWRLCGGATPDPGKAFGLS